MNPNHQTTGSAAIISIGSAFLAAFNVDLSLTHIAAFMSVVASATIIYCNLLSTKTPPAFRAAIDRSLIVALPWLKGLAAAFLGGAAVATYNAVSDPDTYNWSTGLPKLWHSAWTSGLVAAGFYFLNSPFMRRYMPGTPVAPAPASPVPSVDTSPRP